MTTIPHDPFALLPVAIFLVLVVASCCAVLSAFVTSSWGHERGDDDEQMAAMTALRRPLFIDAPALPPAPRRRHTGVWLERVDGWVSDLDLDTQRRDREAAVMNARYGFGRDS